MKRTRWMLPATAFAILALAVLPANALQVLVGYADNLRASPFFPSPFFGDPSVQLFAGQNPGVFSLDSGAVRLHNEGASPVTINSLVVHMRNGAGTLYNLWSGFLPLTLDPGRDAIFVQTAQFNFDSSDNDQLHPEINGVLGNTLNNCSVGPLSLVPPCSNNPAQVIVNGDILLDTGHVLDTGGFDSITANPCINPAIQGNCNESLQWRLIGTCGIECPGGQPVPEPATAYLLGTGLVGLAWASRRGRNSLGTSLVALAWASPGKRRMKAAT